MHLCWHLTESEFNLTQNKNPSVRSLFTLRAGCEKYCLNSFLRWWNLIKRKLWFVTEILLSAAWRWTCADSCWCRRREAALYRLTSLWCFLLVWSTMKTAGRNILDIRGLDNELSVWCCQKSFGQSVMLRASHFVQLGFCSPHNTDVYSI